MKQSLPAKLCDQRRRRGNQSGEIWDDLALVEDQGRPARQPNRGNHRDLRR
jgi:hypothetical protein